MAKASVQFICLAQEESPTRQKEQLHASAKDEGNSEVSYPIVQVSQSLVHTIRMLLVYSVVVQLSFTFVLLLHVFSHRDKLGKGDTHYLASA